MNRRFLFVGITLLLVATGTSAIEVAASASPSPTGDSINSQNGEIDPISIEIPSMTFVETPEIRSNYDKYFYFYRSETSFEEALADVRECDGYAVGLPYISHSNGASSINSGNYGAGGLIGDLVGTAVNDLIVGSADRRALRRSNLRTCMGFKEYGRYGLPKDIWQQFNFEEGLRAADPLVRQRMILQQARIASSAAPQYPELEQ